VQQGRPLGDHWTSQLNDSIKIKMFEIPNQTEYVKTQNIDDESENVSNCHEHITR
jgi:hypothetical protein